MNSRFITCLQYGFAYKDYFNLNTVAAWYGFRHGSGNMEVIRDVILGSYMGVEWPDFCKVGLKLYGQYRN